MRFIDTMILGAGHSVILPHKPESTQIDQLAEYVVAREIKKKLRLDSNLDNVKVILVDPKTRAINDVLWFEEVFKQLG